MKKQVVLSMLSMIIFSFVGSYAMSETKAEKVSPKPRVLIETSMGQMLVELYPEKAPVTVKNFLAYVKEGFYDNTVFHRVIKDFVIQGGGMTKDLEKKKTKKPIINEAKNGLKNARGTLSMARTNDPNSATSQFFINSKDNANLDPGGMPGSVGYAVFGKIVDDKDLNVSSFKTLDEIRSVKTDSVMKNGFPMKDVPVKSVILMKAKIL